MLFLSDITTACRRLLNTSLVLRPAHQDKSVSWFIFPSEYPSPHDWKLWLDFWTSFSGSGWSLHIPLGAWVNPTHRQWEWFYDVQDDLLVHIECDTMMVAYSTPRESHRLCLCSRQVYLHSHALGHVPSNCLPANVVVLPGDQVLHREIGPPLATTHPDI